MRGYRPDEPTPGAHQKRRSFVCWPSRAFCSYDPFRGTLVQEKAIKRPGLSKLIQLPRYRSRC